MAVRAAAGEPAGGHTDHHRATALRALAAQIGTSPAVLARRYVLSLPGVATTVLGVGNRAELAEWLEAERHGPLTDAELLAVRRMHASRS